MLAFGIVCLVSALASFLTLFSGFGLGTLLMPVAALFFPLPVAIAMTAVVHLSNNLFKAILLGRSANAAVLVRFGLPALAAAFLGAMVLQWLSDLEPLLTYSLGGQMRQITELKLVLGMLILVFVGLECWPRFARLAIDPRYLPWGGLLSGFFGGLSGHQGALRSLFLIKSGLSKEAFIATGVLIAVGVDLSRLLLYGWRFSSDLNAFDWPLITAATLSAFFGVWLGKRWLSKVTLSAVQKAVSGMLALIGLGLMAGLV